MKSKGQIDMFGLVIIVVLLIVISLFSLFFILREGGEERDVYYSLRAHNFANALSKSSIGNTNMEALILSCCIGLSGSCDMLLDFSEKEFDKLGFVDGVAEKKARFELKCYNGDSYFIGQCGEGVASESIIFQSQDSIRVILC